MIKNGIVVLSMAALMVCFTQTLQAVEETKKADPCQGLKMACENAGYKTGAAKEGKGLWVNCVTPITEGKTVEGVTLPENSEELAACKAVMAQEKSKKSQANKQKDSPCFELKSACEAAGFKKGAAASGKGLWKNCMTPMVEGQTVEGVQVSSEALSKCKMHGEKERKKEERKNKT